MKLFSSKKKRKEGNREILFENGRKRKCYGIPVSLLFYLVEHQILWNQSTRKQFGLKQVYILKPYKLATNDCNEF